MLVNCGFNYNLFHMVMHSCFIETHLTDMSHNDTPSLLTLPVELIYRILNHLNTLELVVSVRDVCMRLDAITDTYFRYQVDSIFIISANN